MWQVVLFNVTNGLIIGAFTLYVLMALGLSLILNLSNVINFAHGNFTGARRLSRVSTDHRRQHSGFYFSRRRAASRD